MPISWRSSFARFPVKSWKEEKNLKLVGILRAGIENMDALPRSARILARDILRLVDGERARNAPVRDLVDPVNWRKTFGLK